MKHLKILSLLITTVLTACSTLVSPQSSTPKNRIVISNVSIVDVENGVTVPGQTVILNGEQIEQIGMQSDIRIPQDSKVIDGQGLYLMPGLVDAHVHYYDAPVFGRVLIANGVLLIRDMGMPNEYILPLRDELNQGENLGPEMVAAGRMLDGEPPLIPQIAMGISTPEEGRAAVRQQAEAGVDMIKVYSKLDQNVFLAILDEAKRSGLKVVGHVPDSIYVEDAAAAGLCSSEHWFGFEKVIANLLGEPLQLTYTGMGSQADFLQRLDEVDPVALLETYRRLRASGLTVTPTIVTFKNRPGPGTIDIESIKGGEYISQNLLSFWQSQMIGQSEEPDWVWQNWAQMVKGLNQAGVPLMVGTDVSVPGIVPGYSVHEEMLIWQEAGIPATDILRSATIVPAKFMGLEDRLGSIREGKTASMVLVQGNPLEDIHNAQEIEGVFLRGEYFSRQDLDKLLAEAKDLARNPNP
jgi:imidazolonepropionase-like amidohydrolase